MNTSDTRRPLRGFTLIELLVVVTIIVVLLALLVPAMDKAIYQAELAVCGANLKGIAGGVQVYGAENRGFYPHRSAFDSPTSAGQPLDLFYNGFDNRGTIARAMALDILNDPLTVRVDLGTTASTWVMGSYEMWFGFGYNGEKKMKKIGDRFTFTQNPAGGPITYAFDFLATDLDMYFDDANRRAISSHPDDLGVLPNLVYQDRESATFSRWESQNGLLRGGLDLNYAHTDGSVRRHTAVQAPRDDRMTTVAYMSNYNGYEFARLQLPLQ